MFASTTSGKSTLAYCAKKESVCVFKSNVFFVDLLPEKANEKRREINSQFMSSVDRGSTCVLHPV